MSTFHTLHLREPSNKREKSQSQRQQARQRQKAYLKDLLMTNFLKKFTLKQSSGHGGSSGQAYLQQLVGNEVEKFLNNQQLSQKTLKDFERRLEELLLSDPNIADFIVEKNMTRSGMFQQKRESSNNQFQENTNTGSLFALPKINNSVTPTRDQNANVSSLINKRMSNLRKSQIQSVNKSSINPYPKGSKFNLQSHQTLLNKDQQDAVNINPLNSSRPNYNGGLIIRQQMSEARQRNSATSKSFAELKMKMGYKKNVDGEDDKESVPSQIDDDEWVEIVKYEQERFEEDKKKEKELIEKKKKLIRETLDKQLQERREKKLQEMQERQSYDQSLLSSLKEKEQLEKKKIEDLKNKIVQEKLMRDWQLQEAQQKKYQDSIKQREFEVEMVNRLKSELNDEKQGIIEKKRKEREICQKIIQENENYKKVQLLEKEKEKERDNQLREEYNKLIELQEKKRQEEWQQREKRIQSKMNQMADAVRQRNDAEKELENKVMRYQLEKEEQAARLENRKKEILRKRHEEIAKSLQLQMQEKQQQKDQENYVNNEYLQEVLAKDKEAIKKKEEAEKQMKMKKIEIQEFLMKQMEDGKVDMGSSPRTIKKQKAQSTVGGPMSIEELRINKQLLKEISRKKKEKMGGSIASQMSQVDH